MPKSDRILTLDIGASTLKLAEFRKDRSGGLELVHYSVQSLGLDPQNDDDRSRFIVTTLRDMIAENAIKPGPVAVSISGQSVFSRFVPLPPVDEDKVAQIVQYEAQQNVPFPMDEIVWDYQLIGGEDGKVDVMLAAAKSELIEEITDCVSFAGLTPDMVDVAPMTLYNATRYNYGDLEGCTLIVDMGARATDLVFIEDNRVFSRSIPFAGNAITQQIMREFEMGFDEAEDLKKAHGFVAFGGAYEAPSSEVADKVSKSVRTVMTRMHAEINRSISFYRTQQSGATPSRILITGGTSLIPYTDSFLHEKLKVEVDYLNPFLNVAVSSNIDSEEIGETAHLLGEVVGLALRRTLPCPIELDLMPAKVQEQKAFRKKQPLLIASMLFVVIAVILWGVYFYQMGSLAKQRAENINQRLQSLTSLENRMKGEEAALTDVRNRVEEIGAEIGKRSSWVELLEDVHSALVEGMWLSSLESVDAESSQEPAEMDRFQARARGMQPELGPANEDAASGVTDIMIAGYGYADKLDGDNPIVELRNRLRTIPGISSNGTEVVTDLQESPFYRQFQIRIKLEEPIP